LAKSSATICAYSLLPGYSKDGLLLCIGWVMNWPIVPLILQKRWFYFFISTLTNPLLKSILQCASETRCLTSTNVEDASVFLKDAI
jgi:hypothetical protein